MRICYVCDSLVPMNELGFRPLTHIRCRPGGTRWLQYFDALPSSKQTEVGRMIAQGARLKIVTQKERFTKLAEDKETQDATIGLTGDEAVRGTARPVPARPRRNHATRKGLRTGRKKSGLVKRR